MGIEDAFLHDILAHPDDDAPRLIYADWLDEHNDPRGEFIRIQCALAQLNDEDPRRWPLERREIELLQQHYEKWLPKSCVSLVSSGRRNVQCFFRRGFVEHIALSPEQFLASAGSLFEQAPIQRIDFDFDYWDGTERADSSLDRLASSRHLARLAEMRLRGLTASRQELRGFLASPHLQQLTDLELSRLRVEIDGGSQDDPPALPVEVIHDLIELPLSARLASLELFDSGLNLDALRILVNAPLTGLRKLSLCDNRLTHTAATVLAEASLLPQLETLNFHASLLADAGAMTVRDWPVLPRLSRLRFGHNHIFAAGMKALAEAPALRGLISLDLFGNIACDEGTAALASSDWTRLQALNLRFNGVGDRGVRALAQSEALAQLTHLNLTANRVTDEGARALIESRHLPRLARLDLPRNDIGEAGQRRLRDRFGPFVYFWTTAV